jgi:hypothetical protein
MIMLKLKQEKSGWPSWVKTESDCEQYIRNYEDHMGIKLDAKEIETNAGLRAIAKLFLNSFWGKVCMMICNETDFTIYFCFSLLRERT